jgi:ATP-binding cassette subfamily F protein 3
MIQLKHLSLSYGTQVIFDDVSLIINAKDRIGLVGNNGAGKSTLLKLLAQQPCPPGIQRIGKPTIGYIPQNVVLNSVLLVHEELLEGHDCDDTDKERIRTEGCIILRGLGFSEKQLAAPVNTLSVGWKMRLLLGKLLLQKPDFYLFDEPTNHLDIVAKEWFVQFLSTCTAGFILVTHERYFLDMLCTTTIELEMGKAERFEGNYTRYLTHKKEKRERLTASYEQQQKEIAKKQAVIDRFRASASRSTAAKSMQKALDKVERIELSPEMKTVSFSFPPPPPCSRHVLKVNNVSFGYSSQQLFKNATFEVERGQKIALVAANGVGKTTLLNILMRTLHQTKGSITWATDACIAYFEQDQAQALDLNQTIEACVEERVPRTVSSSTIRSLLGCFLFSGDTIYKKVGVLSGGEKNRLAMAIVLLNQANILLLDEPTNHLDMTSKEILVTTLKEFQGTIVFVSHDQDFINRLSTHIIELRPEKTISYPGNYESYVQQKNAGGDTSSPELTVKKTVKTATPDTTKPTNAHTLKQLEQAIAKIEKDIAKLTAELEGLSYESAEFIKKAERLQKMHNDHIQLMHEWELHIT